MGNRGEKANVEQGGTSTKVLHRNDASYGITPDSDENLEPYTVYANSVSTVDKGHGGTRIVTEQAYNELRQQRMTEFQRSCGLER